MQKKQIFRGSATAIVTPFRNGMIDFCAMERLIAFQLENGTDAIVVCGTTGEVSTLTTAERKACFAFAVRTVNGKCPVIAGTGCNDTEYSILLSKCAEECGADGLLLVTPYYNKTTQDGLVQHFNAIANSVSIPSILYNVPSRTGLTISVPTYRKLAENKNIVAAKEASGDLSLVARVAAACGDTLNIYSGNDDQILPVLSLGGCGVISVLGNILPKEMHELCRLYFTGNIKESTSLQLKLLPLIEALFAEVNPIPVKAALSMIGMCEEEVRLPLCAPSPHTKDVLKRELSSLGLLS